jgi:hypothetical protein
VVSRWASPLPCSRLNTFADEADRHFEAVGFDFEGALAGGGEAVADAGGVGGFGGFAFDEAVLFEAAEGFVDGGVIDVDEVVGIVVDLLLDGVAVEGAAGQGEEDAEAGGFEGG